jgi:hypothetical protein
MEVFYWIFCIWVFISLVWFWAKVIKALDNFNKISERFLSITQKFQDEVDRENKLKRDDLIKASLNNGKANSDEFNIGDCVIYPPVNRVMFIREITKDGLYKCFEITDKGEEFAGAYKTNQIIKYNGKEL